MSKKNSLLLLFAVCVLNTHAQLNIEPVLANTANATRMAQLIMGPAFTISNAALIGADSAAGTFNGISSMSLDSGVLLTTGRAISALGPNNQNQVSYAWATPGDADLATMIGAPTSQLHDACALQFDVQVPGTGIAFNYVFGSDEYPEFVCSSFNDAFAIFISGPGINRLKNIAVVPGTTIPVNISSINDGIVGSFSGGGTCTGANQSLAHSQYYVNNGDGTQSPYNTSAYYIQYDGFTTVLTAAINSLIQGQTYHVKLVISDVTDGAMDSGLFIEASNCPTSYLIAKLGTPYTTDTLSPIAVGGCSTGFIPVKLLTPDTGITVLHLGISGTAINGVDYTAIADSVVFNPGDTLYNLVITPIVSPDNTTKSVILYLLTNCGAYSADTLYLVDTFYVQVSPHDTTVCTGAAVQLHATGASNFTWYPASGLSYSTIANPIATPAAGITYYCVGSSGACSAIDSVKITLTQTAPFTLTLTPHDTTVCPGDIVQLQADGGGNSFTWTPNTQLTNATIANPRANPSATTVYTCVSTAGTCSLSDSLTIHVFPPAVATVTQHGDTLTASPAISYEWFFNLFPIFSTDSVIVIPQSGNYVVQITDPNGCHASSDNNYYTYIPTGVQSISNESTISIYPNPSKAEFTVSITDAIENGKLEIYNVLGQSVYSAEIKNQPTGFSKTIQLNVAGGVYLIGLTDGAKTYTHKLVIE